MVSPVRFCRAGALFATNYDIIDFNKYSGQSQQAVLSLAAAELADARGG
jgi:hypothetical protein